MCALHRGVAAGGCFYAVCGFGNSSVALGCCAVRGRLLVIFMGVYLVVFFGVFSEIFCFWGCGVLRVMGAAGGGVGQDHIEHVADLCG